MVQDTHASTTIPGGIHRETILAQRRLAYRMFRKEGLRHNGRLYRLSALQAWRFAAIYPVLARRYAEALS